ncbi:MAG: phosphoglycerate mutase family protein [Proteobacteria bacterium]|nr:phosphoglycerate mutase family protein [Pseudomonadota bacterium]
MSTLYLIRHGQASFGADNYDVLSQIGAEQSRQLGVYWGKRGERIDACYMGPRRRHLDTARAFARGAGAAGVAYPEPTRIDELDEYPAIPLFKRWLPELAKQDPALADATRPDADNRSFERAFGLIIERWARGELDTGEFESFDHFRGRVRTAFDHIMTAEGRHRSIAVFTSGGPIAMAMQWALELKNEVSLRAAWVIANGSINEFRYRDSDQLTLFRFNAIPHLQDNGLITYR